MKIKLLALAASALLAVSIASNANQANSQSETTSASVPATSTNSANMFDPNYWMAAFTAAPTQQPTISGEVPFNAAHPAAWMHWIDPKTHQSIHMSFMNPANYTQFMQLGFLHAIHAVGFLPGIRQA